ncbi:hypothetical protein [Streptococcus suis]|uniref:hypothetical protein n=1 Tax=Streptococcus suis TaxID=1307 RepID=UPI00301023F9
MDTFFTILKNMSWEDRIDWFFRIIQIATFIILIVKVNVHKGYIDNVQLIEIDDLQKIDENNELRFYRSFGNFENTCNHFLFRPIGTDLKKVEIYSLDEEQNKSKLLEKYKDLNNGSALLINIDIMGIMPHHMITWVTDNGEKGEYIFHMNGFNGNMNFRSYRYKYTILGRMRKILGG